MQKWTRRNAISNKIFHGEYEVVLVGLILDLGLPLNLI